MVYCWLLGEGEEREHNFIPPLRCRRPPATGRHLRAAFPPFLSHLPLPPRLICTTQGQAQLGEKSYSNHIYGPQDGYCFKAESALGFSTQILSLASVGVCISQCLMHKSSLRIPVTYSNRYFPSPVSAGQLSLAPDCESGSGSSTGLFWSSARQVLVTQPHGEWRGQEREWKHATVLCSQWVHRPFHLHAVGQASQGAKPGLSGTRKEALPTLGRHCPGP